MYTARTLSNGSKYDNRSYDFQRLSQKCSDQNINNCLEQRIQNQLDSICNNSLLLFKFCFLLIFPPIKPDNSCV